jgi:hypothetical protein
VEFHSAESLSFGVAGENAKKGEKSQRKLMKFMMFADAFSLTQPPRHASTLQRRGIHH